MSSLAVLDRDLCGILAEMRSDKVTMRQKAFERLELILTNREEDILRYMTEQKFDTNWHDVLEAAHYGAEKQNRKLVDSGSSSATGGGGGNEGKSYIYIKVIQKVLDLAMNRGQPQIKFSELIRRSLDVLGDPAMLQYFGVCYVQVLQKHVLNSKWDLTVITYDEWIAILTRCFKLYDDGRVAKQTVVGCLAIAVRKSLENCSVQTQFVKFLSPLVKMITESDRGKILNELIKVAGLCVSALAVDYRYEICSFTERIAQRVVKAYEPKADEETKAAFFRLMHLAVVVHSPEKHFGESSGQHLAYATDQSEWYKCLRNFYFVVGSEIKAHVSASHGSVGGREVPFVDGFIAFAARLCYAMFWNNDVWNQTDCDGGSNVKKVKRANKLQSLMDLIEVESSQPNWRWLIVLAEIVGRCPAVLCEEDYQPLLHLLSCLQPKLQLSSQLKAFHQCCSVLLSYERDECFKKSSMINATFCIEQWHKIIEASFRCSTSNNKLAAENHHILQLLIAHRKYPSVAFLTGLLQAFYSYSIERTNVTVGTIHTLLESVPLEALGDVQDSVEKLLGYLFPKSRENQAKGILHNRERLTVKLLAAISVNCSVTKHQQVSGGGEESVTKALGKYEELDDQIREVESNILLKYVDKLLVGRVNGADACGKISSVTYNIHEKNFEMLCTSLSFEKHTLPTESDTLCKSLINIISDIELYLEILNDLLAHGALNRDTFEKCLITKKITFKIQEVELGFERLMIPTAMELNEMSTKLRAIFQGPYHEYICQLLRVSNFTCLFEWIFKHAKKLPDRDSRHIEALQLAALNKEQLNQHNLLLVLAHYMKYDGVNTNEVKAYLDKVTLNIDNNLDLFHIFEMCKVFIRQRSTFFLADWVLGYVRDICRSHHTNSAMTETIINLFSEMVVFVSPHDGLFNDTNTVLLSFIRKANKANYSVGLQRAIYDQVKFLLKAYPECYESHETIYARMVTLVGSPNFAIKMSAVENLLHLFNDGWTFPVDKVTAEFYRFQIKLYGMVSYEVDNLLTKDEKQNLLAAYIQLICGTVCGNYYLRSRALMDLIEQVHLNQLSQDKSTSIMKQIKTAMNIDPALLIEGHMDKIVDSWISKGYKIDSFPWFVTSAKSAQEFAQKYTNEIAFALLCNKQADLQQFCAIVKMSLGDLIKAISAECIAFLVPKWAKCANLSAKYTTKANAMEHVLSNQLDLKRFVSSEQNNLRVVKLLTACCQDESLMGQMFDREVLIPSDEHVLTVENYVKCLNHYQSLITSKYSLVTYFCMKHPAVIEQLLLGLKLNIYRSEVVEEKMKVLFQYSVVIDQLEEYFCQHRSAHLKEFLARDICYFLCHTMVSCKTLHVPVLNCFQRFLEKVLPTCAEYFRPYLNFITSSMLSVYDHNTVEKVTLKITHVLKMVVVDHQALFGDAIGKLNHFPEDEAFKELRRALQQHKEQSLYKLSLAEDITRMIQLPSLKFEELATMRSMLASRKDELRAICEELQASDGFSEKCSQNALLQLINVLINEIRTSSTEKHRLEALCCLGEIGPVDLSTMLLRSDAQTEVYKTSSSVDEAQEHLVGVMIVELNQLVVSKNVLVAEKAAVVCSHVLQIGRYRMLANNLRTLFPYMVLAEKDGRIFERAGGKTNLSSALNAATNYESFVRELVGMLLEFLQDKVLKSLADVELAFAAKLIPLLVQIILSMHDKHLNEDVGNFVNTFFTMFSDKSSNSCLSKDLEATHLMLTIVECIRLNNQSNPQHSIALNYLTIAAASLHCHAYFKAVLYCEVWAMHERDAGTGSDSIRQNPQLMDIMKTAHLAIGIDDAAKAFIDPISCRSEYYLLERNYAQRLLHYDAASCSRGTFERSVYVEALKGTHLFGLANRMVERSDVDFECAWRLADWSVALDSDAEAEKDRVEWENLFEKQHYKALKCLELKDETASGAAVTEGRRVLAEMLKVASMESTKNVYPFLCKLKLLQQIEDFMSVHFYRVIEGEQELLQKWVQQDKLVYSDFSFMELILSQRLAILKTAGVRAKRKWVPDAMYHAAFQLIHEARVTGHHDVAAANICSMMNQSLTENVKSLVMLEDAQLNWAVGDKLLAKKLVNGIVAGGKCRDLLVNGAAYRIYGSFLADTNVEDVKNLYDNFFKQSTALVEESLRQARSQPSISVIDYKGKCLDGDKNFIVLHTVATYADREFVRLKNHSTSSDFKVKKANVEKMKRELSMIDAELAKLKETEREKLSHLRRAKMSTKQNIARDDSSLKTMIFHTNEYLQMALLYYSSYARFTSIESDLAVFRFIGLWLGNHSEKIEDTVTDGIKVIPTHKIVPVLPQLAPRLDNHTGGVGKIVRDMLERCAIDHPHHTLPHIFAQLYAYADVERTDVPKDDERLLGAQALHGRLAKCEKIAETVQQMSEMNLAFIQMANKALGGGAKGFGEYRMTAQDVLKKCRELDKVHCPTVELPVSESGAYGNIIDRAKKDLKKCVTFDEALELTKFGIFNYTLILISGLILVVVMFEILSISYIIAVAECDLSLTTREKGILSAVVFIGIIVSSHLWGFLADTQGRRKVIIPTLCLAFTSTVCSSFMTSFWWITVFRFMTGFLISGASAPVYAYLGEFHSHAARSRAIMGASFVVGVSCLFLPVVAFLVIDQSWTLTIPLLDILYRPWRLFLVVCGLPGIVGALALMRFPEAPKFVFDHGDKTKTLEILQWMHRINTFGKQPALEIELLDETSESDPDKVNYSSISVSDGFSAVAKKIWDQTAPLFMRPYLGKTALVCSLQFGTYVSAYGMYMFFPGILDQLVDAQEAGLNQTTLCEIVYARFDLIVNEGGEQNCSGSLAMTTYGYSLVLDFIYMLGVAFITAIISYVGGLPILVFIFTCSGIAGILVTFVPIPAVSMWLYMVHLLSCCAMGVINTVAVDLFPTNLRAMAVSVSLMFGQLGSVFGTNMNGLLLDSHCELSFWTSGSMMLVCTGLAFFIPQVLKRKEADADEATCIHKWADQIQGVGGINAPKKLVCHCMDGQERIQLLKGKDDMRQDAVMQQVFGILNVLLRNDKEANRRKLAVRTYKVVPLSRQSGILEWCSNTVPIGVWLIPAHQRYRPQDITPIEARKLFAELAKSSVKTKQDKFGKICDRLSPVFHHFFLERFLMPGMWFERRLCYTKSVAVASMIGYILGIGDRHVQNILVDEKTAEVIHIDFGIAFELGKNLPTPETIPFRLTRDLISGMGISGIEGVFKKSCERTLEILRANHAPIMTILEVLLYDPLYSWNVLTNKKAARRQMAEMYGDEESGLGGGSSVNISAERALLRVSDKLNGKEDEKYTSVEGQVERLIFTASTNLNLCQLFHGWQPYL